MSGITAALSQLIVSSQPDIQAREAARRGIQDFVAASWPVLQRHVADSGLPCLLAIYNGNSIREDALLLGYSGHALDYDDFHADFRGHPSTVILPALLAWSAHNADPQLDRFLDAYIIGVEVAGRLGQAISQQHYILGYHNTASLGTIAAAAALAHLSGANTKQSAVLIGIAATQASGLRAQFGSAVKPLHAGFAAERAVTAAQLALAGFDGQTDAVLDAFLVSSSNGQSQPQRLISDWGQPWRIINPGLEFKPFATCSGTHSAAEATRIIRQNALTGGVSLDELLTNITHIEVAFPPGGDIAASVRVPKSGIEARFSLEYVIAAMLIFNDLRMIDFAEGEVNQTIMGLAAKVRRCPDASAPPDAENPGLRFHEVTVYLQDGTTLQCRRTRQQSLEQPVDVAGKLTQALAAETPQQREHILSTTQLRSNKDLTQLAAAMLAGLR